MYLELITSSVYLLFRTTANKFVYMPLVPRIERMIGNANLFAFLQYHLTREQMQGVMADLIDSPLWRKWFAVGGVLSDAEIGIALAACGDDIDPWGEKNKPYSCWPLFVQLLNMPPRVRKNSGGYLDPRYYPPGAWWGGATYAGSLLGATRG